MLIAGLVPPAYGEPFYEAAPPLKHDCSVGMQIAASGEDIGDLPEHASAQKKLTEEVDAARWQVGRRRPSRIIRTASLSEHHILAIDIGGTKVSLGVFRNESLVERHTASTVRSGGPDWMITHIEKIAAPWVQKYGIQQCGGGFGGPFDSRRQRVICSTHVEGWTNYDLIGALRDRLGVDAVFDRDTMVGALGEGVYGAGKDVRPLFYMTISTGIGGGLLTDSGLYAGADSFACEIGHHTIDPEGPECLCGSRGCLERYCAGLWLERDYGRPASELLREPVFVQRYVRYLAQGIKTAIMMFNPARVVIGGGISKSGNGLFAPLREELGRQITSWSRARVDVQPAALGDDTILFGALALAAGTQPASRK